MEKLFKELREDMVHQVALRRAFSLFGPCMWCFEWSLVWWLVSVLCMRCTPTVCKQPRTFLHGFITGVGYGGLGLRCKLQDMP